MFSILEQFKPLFIPLYSLAFQTYRPPKYEIPMRIQGSLPAWLSGTLFRTSPGLFDISYSVTVDDDQKELHWIRMGHWFDQ